MHLLVILFPVQCMRNVSLSRDVIKLSAMPDKLLPTVNHLERPKKKKKKKKTKICKMNVPLAYTSKEEQQQHIRNTEYGALEGVGGSLSGSGFRECSASPGLLPSPFSTLPRGCADAPG